MLTFILIVIFWTLALYGLIEIIRNVYYILTYTNLKSDGIYLIVAVKNQEQKIEGFLRTILFRLIYGREEQIKQIILTDIGSSDDTLKILTKIRNEYGNIKLVNWKECKDLIDNIKQA